MAEQQEPELWCVKGFDGLFVTGSTDSNERDALTRACHERGYFTTQTDDKRGEGTRWVVDPVALEASGYRAVRVKLVEVGEGEDE